LQHTKKKIKREQNTYLCKEPTEEEIVEAIWNLHPDKALGPDGFTIAFFRNHWYTIRKDFIRMVKNTLKEKYGRQYKILLSGACPKRGKSHYFQ